MLVGRIKVETSLSLFSIYKARKFKMSTNPDFTVGGV